MTRHYIPRILNAKCALIIDSTRSPTTLSNAHTTPIRIDETTGTSGAHVEQKKYDTTVDKTTPPTTPSMVFFGDTRSNSLFFPNALPANKPPESADQVRPKLETTIIPRSSIYHLHECTEQKRKIHQPNVE